MCKNNTKPIAGYSVPQEATSATDGQGPISVYYLI